MKKFSILVVLLFSFGLQAQQRKAVTYQQQVQSQRAVKDAPKSIPETKFRIIALFDEAFTNPEDLNTWRAGPFPGSGSFSSMPGFAVSIGYKSGNGVFSLELDQHGQKLSSYAASATTTIRDSVETETLQLVYDHVFQGAPEDSFELGIGAGKALKLNYISAVTNTTVGVPTTETGITWGDTPFVFKVRSAYNYYFSANVGLRLALGYQFVSSDELKAQDSYNYTYLGQPITSGRVFKDSANNNIKLDVSGFTAALGLSINF